MPSPTLDATVGGASSNSYISRATADLHFANLLSFSAWDALDNDTKERALISATSEIEMLDFWGRKTDVLQSLEFPRICGTEDSTAIPDQIIAAVAELALKRGADSVSGATSNLRETLRAAGVTSYRLGDHAESYQQGGGLAEISGSAGILSSFPPAVQRLLSGWLKLCHNSDSGRQSYGGNYDRYGHWWPEPLSD